MSATCPACGASTTADARACPTCQQSLLPAMGLGSWARYSAPASYTPPHLTERILRHRSAIEGEHKRVTVLFCDLVASTELSARLGPERMHGLLSQFFETALTEVHRYEGTVNQFLGDGFMALFGAPLALEQHERQAVLAALGVQRAVADQIPELADPQCLRMGLNTGNVVVGKIGDNLRMDYTAVGGITSVAARLQAAAAPGDILLSADTWERARRVVLAEPTGPLDLKGLRDSVQAYRLRGHRPIPPGESALADRRLSPFVARARDLAVLEGVLGEAERGQGSVVGIVGDPGLGKSRLLYELRRRLEARRVVWREGHCLAFGTAIPFLPILEVLRGHCGIIDSDTPETVAAKVRAIVDDVGLDPTESIPYLLHFLGLKDDADLDSPSPEVVKARTFDILRQLAVRGSHQRPLVLVVEDVHWIDQASEEFLASLIGLLPGAPILCIATYRPGYHPPWLARGYASQIALRPLSEDDGRQVVEAALGGRALPADVTATVLRRGEGNPFFLEELSHTLSTPGLELTTADAIPGTLQGLLMARIDRLPDATKRLLQIAAVIGREFPVDLAAAIRTGASVTSGDEPALRIEVAELTCYEFIVESARDAGNSHAFRHALTRDAVYASLLEGQRRRYHGAVASALESAHAGHLEPVVELIANHFLASGLDDEALEYAGRAAEKAQRRSANAEAIAFTRAVLDRLDAMPATPENNRRRIDAVLQQAEIRLALGQHVQHLKTLEHLRPLVDACAGPRQRATWLYWTGFFHTLVGTAPEVAIAYCREAAGIAEREGLDEIGAFADACLAQALVFAGDLFAAVSAGERALAIFEARGNLRWAWRVLAQLSPAENARGNWERSLAHCRRASEYGARLDDVRLRLQALARAASTHAQRGDSAAALKLLDEAMALGPSPYDATALRAIRGLALVKTGRTAEGVADLAAAVAWCRDTEMTFTGCQFSLWLVGGYVALGERDRAQAVLAGVRRDARRLGYALIEALAARDEAELIAGSRPEDSRAMMLAAEQRLEGLGAAVEQAKTLAALGILARDRGDPETARALLARAHAVFEESGTLDGAALVRHHLDQLDARHIGSSTI